jgi:four helix bundle protein
MAIVQDLEIYKRAHIFAMYMYEVTANFPKEEVYGLTSQIRRAAVSINANIMEGSARKTNNEYRQFLYIARGSIEELTYHMTVAKDLKYMSELVADKCIEELRQMGKMVNGLIKCIK